VDPAKLLAFATMAYGGGTDWEGPLRLALEFQERQEYRNGDVVLVTDGICALSDDFRVGLDQAKATRDLRVYGVLVGSGDAAAIGFCDRIWAARNPEDVAEDLMMEVARDR
jgi:uncharacterized protein with von Willebrand factor type A (vWA) domain